MKRSSLLVFPAFAMVLTTACSKDAAAPTPQATPPAVATAAPAASKTAADDRLPKIPILPGFKYYAGGPRMKADAYGRFRLSGFMGEVQQPSSRGMIFAAKVDGDAMEYRVWGNGILLGVHKGTMRDGAFWQTYVEGYRDGKLVARENTVNDDAAKVSNVTMQDLDPDTGEVIRTQESHISYLPPDMPKEDEAPGDDEDAPAVAPAALPSAAVPSTPPAAAAPVPAKPPVVAAPGAAK